MWGAMPTSAPKSVKYARNPHKNLRKRVAEAVDTGGVRCARCGEPIMPGQPWDLGHVDGGGPHEYSGPEHRRCNRATAGRYWWATLQPELPPERDGVPASDPRWRVPWLTPFLDVPSDATWPRLMSLPHERAAASLGDEFAAWAETRTGRPLRWWQRLFAVRLLEVDDAGALVWDGALLSTARQVGKSWGLRELMLWRIEQGGRFGEPQDVMHTGKDLAICKEVQRPARLWAKAQPGRFKVREVNGQEEIELLADGSRWMLRAKEAVYGYGASLGVVDEAWKVKAASIDEGLVPTMVERAQPQLLLASTAHRLATSLMLGRRQGALASLEDGGGDLLVEWSAPPGAELDDVDAWRLASPHWTPRRQRLIQRQLDALRAGEIDDPEEPDPEASFRAQWMNQWPRARVLEGEGEQLLPDGLWDSLADDLAPTDSPVFVALEDDYGMGAAVAAAVRLDDGRIEVDGWLCTDWNAAIHDAVRLGAHRQIRQLHVGASLLDRVPPALVAKPAGTREVRAGLALLRDLAAGGVLAHDGNGGQLADALAKARVKEAASGLALAGNGSRHLVRALVWAVLAAHKPSPSPGVY
jgi:hypothetical protein